MINFKALSEGERNMAWDRFYDLFHFKPSVQHFPGIKTSAVKLKFTTKDFYSSNYGMEILEEFALYLFNKLTTQGEKMYALDWHHECYDFDPRGEMDRNEFGEWMVPAYPDGDYYIFLTKDFSNVWFGHPWENSITLVGREIVMHAKAFAKGIPLSKF